MDGQPVVLGMCKHVSWSKSGVSSGCAFINACPTGKSVGPTDRQTGSQSDRQTDRQAGRQLDIPTDRQTGRQLDIPTDRQADRQSVILTDKHTDRQAVTQSYRQSDRHTVATVGIRKSVAIACARYIVMPRTSRIRCSESCYVHMQTCTLPTKDFVNQSKISFCSCKAPLSGRLLITVVVIACTVGRLGLTKSTRTYWPVRDKNDIFLFLPLPLFCYKFCRLLTVLILKLGFSVPWLQEMVPCCCCRITAR